MRSYRDILREDWCNFLSIARCVTLLEIGYAGPQIVNLGVGVDGILGIGLVGRSVTFSFPFSF